MRENLAHLAGIQSASAKAQHAQATERISRWVNSGVGMHEAAKHGKTAPKAHRMAVLAYRQGVSHGLLYGLIIGCTVGAMAIAGLIVLGTKVGL